MFCACGDGPVMRHPSPGVLGSRDLQTPPTGLRGRRLRNLDGHDSFRKRRLHLVHIHPGGQRDQPLKTALGALQPITPLFLGLRFHLFLATQHKRVVFHGSLHILALHARQFYG